MIDEQQHSQPRPLHLRWQVHVLFWLAYMGYRSLLAGVLQGNLVHLQVIVLDLPLKLAVSYLAILVLLPQFRARRWAWLCITAVLSLSAVALLRQALWHGLIFPHYFPTVVHEPGFFDLPDLASNLSSIAPVATVLLLIWLASASRAQQPTGAERAPATALPASHAGRLQVQLGSRSEDVEHADIHYVAADGDYVNVILAERQLRMRNPLKQVAEQLPSPPFLQIHRRYLINLDQLTAHTASQARVGEIWLPVGRTYRARFRNALRAGS